VVDRGACRLRHDVTLSAPTSQNLRGEITHAQKSEFLSGALALIVPIDCPEPFGLVMIEAMACGTPVIAFNRGSVPEVIEDGLTGFVVEDETSAVGVIRQLSRLSAQS
jgi:glycosyltransferase involved in cell wall biosynthesis